MAASAGATALQARALRWLAQREHSRSELRTKLLRAAESAARARVCDREAEAGLGEGADEVGGAEPGSVASAAEVDALLDRLQQRGLLSDERFIASRVRMRGAAHGLRRIEVELSRHALELPATERQRLLTTELPRAIDLWRRRYGGPAADPRERARQVRFLAGRGFSAEVIHQAAAQLRRAGGDASD